MILINLQIKNLKITLKIIFENKDIEKKYDLNFNRAIWHNAYYSLGYLSINNKEVPIPTDSYSVKKARDINPHVIIHSDEYEKILKNEYIN